MKYHILLALGLVFALTLPLHARHQKNDGQAPQKNHGGKAFKKADADGDGFLSKAEFLTRAEKVFTRKDKNADGKLSRAELAPHKPKAKQADAKKGKGHKKAKRPQPESPSQATATPQ